jgi:hypothetical protein
LNKKKAHERIPSLSLKIKEKRECGLLEKDFHNSQKEYMEGKKFETKGKVA